jgi:hypothetical protein
MGHKVLCRPNSVVRNPYVNPLPSKAAKVFAPRHCRAVADSAVRLWRADFQTQEPCAVGGIVH